MTKKNIIITALTALLSCTAMTFAVPQTAKADNPAIQTIYSTDPAPMVYGDTVYLYTGRDKDGSTNYYMPDWHCFSSQDMQNWTDHGTILSWDSFTWGVEDSAWAAQCIERNGKFYYYVTLNCNDGRGRGIGVAVSDSPTGPFKDALGKPLCGPNWEYIDPTVFIDDDGQAWLMFGNPSCYYVKLNEDMISLNGQIGKNEMNAQTFGPSSKASSYGEGPWFYKRNDLYYLVFAAFYGSDGGESLGYSTASSPTGPWKYGGQVMKTHNCFTNHPGVIDFKGKSYLFYHDASLPGGGSFTRSVCIDEFQYGADGSIPTISPTKSGPAQVQAFNPFRKVEAETMCWSSGVKTEKCSEGGMNLSMIEDGDYVKIKGVDFGSGANKFTASVASAENGGMIELHTGSEKGPMVGTCKVSGTGGWQNWEEVSGTVNVSGTEDLYIVFKGDSGYLMNVDWWQFSGDGAADIKTEDPTQAVTKAPTTAAPTSAPVEGEIFHHTFESGVNGWTNRFGAEVASSSGAAYKGSKSLAVTDRTDAYTGAAFELGSQFKAGQEYSFSANVMYPTGNDTVTFHFTLSYDGTDDETHYEKIATGTLMKGKWTQLANTNFKLPAGASNMQIYVETDKGTCDFYVDEVVAASAGTVIEGAGKALHMSPGDVNCDGAIDAFDVVFARQGMLKGFSNKLFEKGADADRSGQVEVNDIVLIQEYALGKIKEFPNNAPEPPKSDFNYNANLQYYENGDYLKPAAQQGKIIKENYSGINGNKSMNVYLPYGYDESKKYNIFYLMHGGSENENTIFSDDVKMNIILDNMIQNGDLEPMIVVTPTFNGCPDGAGDVWNEMRQTIIPYIEKKYSTYAEGDVSLDNLKATRYHRAYGGFSMGGGSTWNMLINNLDICAYYMPLSGHCWGGLSAIQSAIDKSGFSPREYFILAATGDQDLAYENMLGLINPMKQDTKHFTYTSDFSEGNFYFLVARSEGNSKKTHWWGFVRWYIMDALPYFFHEGQ